MSKRGPKPLPPERRRSVRVTVAVTEQCSDGLSLYARRHRGELSTVLSKLLERLAQREKELNVYRNRDLGWPIAR